MKQKNKYILKVTMPENFSNLITETKPQIQNVPKTPSRINTKKHTQEYHTPRNEKSKAERNFGKSHRRE